MEVEKNNVILSDVGLYPALLVELKKRLTKANKVFHPHACFTNEELASILGLTPEELYEKHLDSEDVDEVAKHWAHRLVGEAIERKEWKGYLSLPSTF